MSDNTQTTQQGGPAAPAEATAGQELPAPTAAQAPVPVDPAPLEPVASSDTATAPSAGNQVSMRREYRQLTPEESQNIIRVKTRGQEFHDYLSTLEEKGGHELHAAKTKIEEAVMWAVKHITG